MYKQAHASADYNTPTTQHAKQLVYRAPVGATCAMHCCNAWLCLVCKEMHMHQYSCVCLQQKGLNTSNTAAQLSQHLLLSIALDDIVHCHIHGSNAKANSNAHDAQRKHHLHNTPHPNPSKPASACHTQPAVAAAANLAISSCCCCCQCC